MNQLYELLTEYGPIHEVWFDGAHPKRKGGQKYNYSAWKELIHKLAPKAVIFKTYKQDIARNLNAGFKIHYTTDGSTPTAESKEYTQPFALESGMVKAVALLNDEKGEVCQQQLGCRYHYFKKPVKARFIRIEANEKIAKGAIGYDLF